MVLNKKTAFTLVETLVVVSIIGFTVSAGLAAYNSFTESKRLDTDTQKLIDVVNLTKQKAISGDTSASPNCNLAGTEIWFTSSDYTTYAICGSSQVKIQNYKFTSNNVSVVQKLYNGTDVGVIRFVRLTGQLFVSSSPSQPLNPMNGTASIIFKNANNNQCAQVTINSVGNADTGPITCP